MQCAKTRRIRIAAIPKSVLSHLDEASNVTVNSLLDDHAAAPIAGAVGGPVTPVRGDADEHVKPPNPLSAIAKHAYVSPGREENVAWSGVAAGDTVCVYTPDTSEHDGSTTPPDRSRAHLTTYCTTGGLPVFDEAVKDTSSAPTPDDDTSLMAGADGGTAITVTAFDADEHTSPGATPLLATTKHTYDVSP